jgi:hypothetical protein
MPLAIGERVDVVERVARFGQVDEQHVRAGGDRERLHRVAQPALVDLLRRPAELDRDRAHQLCRGLIADKGGERIAASRAAGVEGCVHFGPPLDSAFTVAPPPPLGAAAR